MKALLLRSIILILFFTTTATHAQIQILDKVFWQSYDNDSLGITLKFPREFSSSSIKMDNYHYIEIVSELEDQQTFIALIKVFNEVPVAGNDERNIDFLNEIEAGFNTSNSKKTECTQFKLQGREAEYSFNDGTQNQVFVRVFCKQEISIALFYVKPLGIDTKIDNKNRFYKSLRI